MSACWPLQIPPTAKSVLISLADNANDHGVCWPAIATISKRTCYSKATVIRAIEWLEQGGLLVADRSNGRHSKYQIVVNLDLFKSEEAASHRYRLQSDSGITEPRDRLLSAKKPVAHCDTNRKEPSLTNSTDAPVDKSSTSEEHAGHDDNWRENLPQPKPKIPASHTPAPRTRRMSDAERKAAMAKHLPDVVALARKLG